MFFGNQNNGSRSEKNAFVKAAKLWEKDTCIDFIENENGEEVYLNEYSYLLSLLTDLQYD